MRFQAKITTKNETFESRVRSSDDPKFALAKKLGYTQKEIALYKRMIQCDDGRTGETQLGWPGQKNFLSGPDRTRAIKDGIDAATAAFTLVQLKVNRIPM